MQSSPFLRIGTRGSALALVQARLVQRLLAEAHGVDPERIEIHAITTSGDTLKDAPLGEVGGKGLFSKEIEAALDANEVDIGVHSSKDMATTLPGGLRLAAFLEREDIRDAFVSLRAKSVDELPRGARLGSSSLRRAAQMLRARPDLQIVPIRGNVETRLKKVESGEVDATLLASAGLKWLDIVAGTAIPVEIMLPAPGQAVIGMECRTNDTHTQNVLSPVSNEITYNCIMAERAFTRALGGSCHSPVAAFCAFDDGDLRMRAQLFSEDGADMVEERAIFDCWDYEPAEALAEKLLSAAPESIRRLFTT